MDLWAAANARLGPMIYCLRPEEFKTPPSWLWPLSSSYIQSDGGGRTQGPGLWATLTVPFELQTPASTHLSIQWGRWEPASGMTRVKD